MFHLSNFLPGQESVSEQDVSRSECSSNEERTGTELGYE